MKDIDALAKIFIQQVKLKRKGPIMISTLRVEVNIPPKTQTAHSYPTIIHQAKEENNTTHPPNKGEYVDKKITQGLDSTPTRMTYAVIDKETVESLEYCQLT